MSARITLAQGVHLGDTGTPATLNAATLPIAGQLGMAFELSGKVYRIVKFDNGTANVASAAGGAAHWKDRANFVVTSDQTDAQATINSVAGGFLGVVTDQYYCCIQIGGRQTVITDGNADIGDLAIGTTTDLTFAGVTGAAAPYFLAYGVFYSDDGATTSADMYWLLGATL